MVTIEQVERNCIVTLDGTLKTIKNCNAIILANTLWDKPGAKYTEERMEEWGFVLKYKKGKMKDIPEEGMRVHVYSADTKKDWGFGTIEKVEPLIVEETDEVLTAMYPSRIVLDSGEVTEGLSCWWITVEKEEEILKEKNK